MEDEARAYRSCDTAEKCGETGKAKKKCRASEQAGLFARGPCPRARCEAIDYSSRPVNRATAW